MTDDPTPNPLEASRLHPEGAPSAFEPFLRSLLGDQTYERSVERTARQNALHDQAEALRQTRMRITNALLALAFLVLSLAAPVAYLVALVATARYVW